MDKALETLCYTFTGFERELMSDGTPRQQCKVQGKSMTVNTH